MHITTIKKCTTIFFTLVTFLSFSQNHYFNNAVDFNNQVDLYYKIIHITDSNYVCVGKSLNPQNLNEGNYLVFVNNTDGSLDTVKNYFFPNTKYWGGKGEITSDNSFIHISTKIHTDIGGDEDLFLVKLNLVGDTLWTKTFRDTSYLSNGVDVVETDDNGFMLVGWEYEKSGWDTQLFLIKTDSLGNELWKKNFQNPNYIEVVFSMIKSDDGGFIFSGKEAISGGDYAGTIYKVDSVGNQVWKKIYNNNYTGGDAASDVIKSKEGGYMVVGGATIDNVGRGFIWKVSENGVSQWDSIYGVPNTFNMDLSEGFMNVLQLEDSSYIMTGTTRNVDLIVDGILGEDDGWILKTDVTGHELWSRVYTNSYLGPSSKYDYFYDVASTNDGGFVAIGSCMNATQDGWIIKLDSCGCDSISCWYDSTQNCGIQVVDTIDTIGVLETQNRINLLELYPNPANATLNIRFPFIEKANIKIVDIEGRVLHSFLIEYETINEKINVSNYPKGTYFAHLLSNKHQLTRRFIVE